MNFGAPIIAVITRETRLSRLKARWTTKAAAEFRMHHAASHEMERRRQHLIALGETLGESDELEFEEAAEALADHATFADEDRIYHRAVQQLIRDIDLGFPVRTVDRSFLPNFDFQRCIAAVVIGPDGLVANAAKYVGDLPLVGINPDPTRNDGLLLPFGLREARAAVQHALDRTSKTRDVTLAEVNTNDGQRMLAFNDFFVGRNSHVSARYTLETNSRRESQSSSGVLVATGAGSTGWLSSMFNMVSGISRQLGGHELPPLQLRWEDRQLVWMVREPFSSRHSGAEMVTGDLDEGQELVIGSHMPSNGVIFSDGIESDFLEFNAGSIASFTVSKQRARLVVP